MTYRILGYVPDGAEPLVERLSWKTAVLTGSTGQEFRRRLRSRPLYNYEYTFVASDDLDHGYAQLLEDLRDWQGEFKVPLWPHAVPGPGTPVAGRNTAGECLGFRDDGTVLETHGGALPGFRYVVPAALGKISQSRTIQHTTNYLASASVSVDLLNHLEDVPAYDRFDSGYAMFDFLCDWSGGAAEELKPDTNELDFGGLWLSETRYTERTVSLEIVLTTPEEVARYRAFLFHVAGRFRSFWAQPATDEAPRLWRLNTDNVELLYADSYVVSKITIKQL